MKEGIHPNYQQTTITCACGNVIETGSTKSDIKGEVCSKCHPFFTGKQKLVDTGGRVAKFNKKFGLNKEACTLRHIQQWSASADHCFFIAFFQNSDILDTSMKWETHLTRGLPNARRDTFVTEKGRNSR